jgi:hypothetical protein
VTAAPAALDVPRTDVAVTDVVYVGGAGRSGSTVLALLLAQLPGFTAVGGLANLWQRGLQQNYLCGCGLRFRECPFWDAVGQDAFGGWDEVDVNDVLRLRASVVRYRHWPAHLAPRLNHRFFANAAEYAQCTGRVYSAIARVSGSRTVVDNSHDISPALLLGRTPGVRAHIIHLVRDSRGVAFSLARYVARAEATEDGEYMPRFAPVRAGTEWLLANLPYHLIPASKLPRLRIQYEALVASPADQIRRIADFLGVRPSAAELSIYEADSIPIAENHMVSGNPHRLGRKQLQLRLDDEWRAAMKPSDRLLTTLLTLPLGLAYGYVGTRTSWGGGWRQKTRNP